MGYSSAQYATYSFGLQDFADAPEVFSFKLPSGKQGTLVDVCISCVESFNATTTEARLDIGTATDPDAYARCGLGTTADTDTYLASENTGDIISSGIPAGTQVEVTMVANTGGTPTGKGLINIVVAVW
jgi:hypothetical protein